MSKQSPARSFRHAVTLDPDVDPLLRKAMKDRGITFKEAVNEAIRKGVAPQGQHSASFPTYDIGTGSIPGHKALQLAGELEDEVIMRKMRLGGTNDSSD